METDSVREYQFPEARGMNFEAPIHRQRKLKGPTEVNGRTFTFSLLTSDGVDP